MAEPEKITITLDDSYISSVCDYSVGFLRFRKGEKEEFADPIGTGTFVKLGHVYGILTAGHVFKVLDPASTVGLVRFPSVQPPIQNRRLDLKNTDRIVDWNGKDGDAPDIAFLKIPEVDGRQIEAAGAVFYNLGIVREFKKSKPEHHKSVTHAVVGVVAEWTEQSAAEFGKGKKIVIGGLFGNALNLREFEEKGTKLVEADISHGPRIPGSHGGVSGGALWELHVELDAGKKFFAVNKRLRGVAFRESADHKRVTSNDTSSIDGMIAKIRKQWPQETKD